MDRKHIIIAIVCVVAVCAGAYFLHKRGYDAGYSAGYKIGYDAGYSAGYKEANKLVPKPATDAVQAHTKTETKVVYKTIPYSGSDVQVKTETPKVTVSVNGKKQEVVQHSETADLAVKTETAVQIKVPERKWSVGIGTDGHKATYMLKAPLKGAIGIWAAGNRDKCMGGVSISF